MLTLTHANDCASAHANENEGEDVRVTVHATVHASESAGACVIAGVDAQDASTESG